MRRNAARGGTRVSPPPLTDNTHLENISCRTTSRSCKTVVVHMIHLLSPREPYTLKRRVKSVDEIHLVIRLHSRSER
jgi:hypothetical protein